MCASADKCNEITKVPPFGGRYVVFDTETTGLNPRCNNVIEIAAVEICGGKLTGNQFHTFLRPRYKVEENALSKHHMAQDFYDKYYNEAYESDKSSLTNFLEFIGKSIIFAHNAEFDIQFINNELKFYGLKEIPKKSFRCSMKIFKTYILPGIPFSENQSCSLSNCCEFYRLTSPRENFHSAIYETFMTARLVCSMFKTIKTLFNSGLNYDPNSYKEKSFLKNKRNSQPPNELRI